MDVVIQIHDMDPRWIRPEYYGKRAIECKLKKGTSLQNSLKIVWIIKARLVLWDELHGRQSVGTPPRLSRNQHHGEI